MLVLYTGSTPVTPLMSAKIFRLTVESIVKENGYEWKVVECPQCGESAQRRHIRDDDHREDVCPACDQEMTIGGDDGITIPNIQSGA